MLLNFNNDWNQLMPKYKMKTKKKLLVITRQGRSILLFWLLYIFIQYLTYTHIRMKTKNFSLAVFWAAASLHIASSVTPEVLLFNCFSPLFLIDWESPSLIQWPSLPRCMTATEKELLSKKRFLVSLHCFCFSYHFEVTELYDLQSTRLIRDSMLPVRKLPLNHHLIVPLNLLTLIQDWWGKI